MSEWVQHMEDTIRANWARHIREADSRICTDALVSSRYLLGIVATGSYMRDATRAVTPREVAKRATRTVPFDTVEHALNERRRRLTQARVERFRMEPEPRRMFESPAFREAMKVRGLVGLWVPPERMHPAATVTAVWYGRDRRKSDIVVRKARKARPMNFPPMVWKDIPESHASQECGDHGPVIMRRMPG